MWRGIVCEAVDEIVLEQFLRHLLHELVCDVSSAYSRLTPYPPTSYLFVSRRSGESHCKLCFLPTANIPIYIRECTFTSIRPHQKKKKKWGKTIAYVCLGNKTPKHPFCVLFTVRMHNFQRTLLVILRLQILFIYANVLNAFFMCVSG